MKKPVIITIIFVIILALIGGGVFWYLKEKDKPANPPVTENENQPSENPKSEITNPKSEIINTDDWLTYRNEEYGFEFNYPSNLLRSKNEYYNVVLSNTLANININILNEGLDPNTIKSPIGIVRKESLEKAVVGGKNSYRFKDGDMGYGGNSYRIPLDNSHTLILWFVTEGGYYNNEKKIISTFKFIK